MSANTSISEGGKPRPFGPVKALMVQGEDGKYYPWFPESDRALGTLSVDKNGIYRASDKGVYGWSRIYVNVPTSDGVTGRDPDTGEDVYVHPDPSGELVKDVLPVEIRVIEPPTNPYGTYVDRQTITKDGMVVKAYGANGDEMLTVPIGEITINPTTAAFDESAVIKGETIAVSDISEFEIPIYSKTTLRWGPLESDTGRDWSTYMEYSTGGTIAHFRAEGSNYLYTVIASKSMGAQYTTKSWRQYDDGELIGRIEEGAGTCNTEYEHDGKIVYYSIIDRRFFSNSGKIEHEKYCPVPSGYNFSSKNFKNAIWTMVYGDLITTPDGSIQSIAVNWPRPGDGAVLETTFDILVGPHGGTGDD